MVSLTESFQTIFHFQFTMYHLQFTMYNLPCTMYNFIAAKIYYFFYTRKYLIFFLSVISYFCYLLLSKW